jgi:(p)ppGpp synthase/HD superfamily hydrolase
MNLQRAIEIAVKAHGDEGHVDKGGSPYILHPFRVMLSLKTEEERIVGVLHDVIEDCPDWTFDRLREEGFSEVVIAGLQSVTKTSEDEDYDEFVSRCVANPIGRRVKIADITDNLDVTRLGTLTEKDIKRLNKYKKALMVLHE